MHSIKGMTSTFLPKKHAKSCRLCRNLDHVTPTISDSDDKNGRLLDIFTAYCNTKLPLETAVPDQKVLSYTEGNDFETPKENVTRLHR